jgi:hypothetical protein
MMAVLPLSFMLCQLDRHVWDKSVLDDKAHWRTCTTCGKEQARKSKDDEWRDVQRG